LPRSDSEVAGAGMYRSGSTAVSSRYSATASLVGGSASRGRSSSENVTPRLDAPSRSPDGTTG
jgi:hypothetical protein